ncbi:hypothetical protein PPACK8108_LOCUS6734 [Phakopsora pachyrhizi]|uniref:Uncharacterized protein n=1 Tax=Phakopsora pachyrhizi TaxID=170000 RepID=A0AAV0ARM9_PHAPC|nr:hypothetical protein PPACK8108_LOCUS6734 [Phakopsora pachyrhizi]
MGNVPSQQNSNQSNRTNINQASSSSSYSSPSSSPSSPSTLPSSNISNNHQYSNNLLPKISTSHPINNNQSNQPLIQSSSLPTPSPSTLLSSNISSSSSSSYYPSNINYSRCCQQPICTECFVQIKRADPTPQELKSEPACCPYCVESNFGVTYEPPPPDQRTGWTFPVSQSPLDSSPSPTPPVTSPGTESDDKRLSKRRQTTSHTSQEVVTTDSIQEDWQIKLESVKAAVQRRANRRIIFRQDGDRLVPIGITSSGGGDVDGSSRRRRNHRNQSDPQQQRHYGLELEELMVMEAMRLSLVDEEERKRKEKDEEESLKKIKLAISDATTSGTDQASTSKSAVEGGLRDDETGGLRGKAEGVRSMGHPDSGVCKLEQLKLDTVSSDKQQQQQQSSSSSLLAPLSLSPVEVGAGGLVSSLLEQADSDVVDVGSGTEDQTDINLSQ